MPAARRVRILDDPSRWGLKGLRVLLVEDNEINQQVAVELMQSAGWW